MEREHRTHVKLRDVGLVDLSKINKRAGKRKRKEKTL